MDAQPHTSRGRSGIWRTFASVGAQLLLAGTALALRVSPACAYDGHGHSTTRVPPAAAEMIDGISVTHAVVPAELLSALAALHKNVPAFSRQTGLACSACHFHFPQLTPFGRLFKLNGYTLTGLTTIGQPGDSAGKETLKLSPIPGIATMLVGSVTSTKRSVAGTQNGAVVMPDQFSIFAAGEITPNLGAFTQFTYSAPDGTFGIDNIDVRFANRGTLADREIIYGLTLHNNPTVQDVWNTVPAWGFPFLTSPAAPSPAASTLIDGVLGQQVLGLGAYSLFNSSLYTEFTAYRSAEQGVAIPLDSTATNVTAGVIPYWRVALQHETPNRSLMLGTFGLDARLYPTGVTGPRNHYTDVAVDAQVEQRKGTAAWIGRAAFIHEQQQLFATHSSGEADNFEETLSTLRANVAYIPNYRYGLTLEYFQTTGTTDAALYPEGDVTGSRTGSPNSSGLIGEIEYNAWQNARIAFQYTNYFKFNGATTAYDVPFGRNASNNNTFYFYAWLAF
jgi:hypothetical protein